MAVVVVADFAFFHVIVEDESAQLHDSSADQLHSVLLARQPKRLGA